MLMVSTPQQLQAKEVKVKVLLSGGHHYTLTLPSNSPLLLNLLKVLVVRTQQTPTFSTLFQIPIDDGHSTLCFPSDQLIGIVTDPPIYVQQQEAKSPVEVPQETQPAIVETPRDMPPAIKTPAPPNPQNELISSYAQIDNFLTQAELKRLLDYVFEQESAFVPTSTSTNDSSYRRSMVLHSFPEFSDLMLDRVKAVLPEALAKLNLPTFRVGDIEAQLTMHNDGNYYRLHNDNGSPDTANRFFTYVYYFYREPKGFSGGELRLYDTKIENNYYVAAETFRDIEPRNNSVIFFLSRYMHEVLPVRCPSKAFADSRFTINGWVRRLD